MSNAESVGGFPSSDGPEDRGNNSSSYRERRVGVPLVDDAMEAAGLWSIKEYIRIWQATIVVQVACRPIYELCTRA